ncbi:MAG TPA: TMAO reductase system periplasmic protein TorT [Reyranella sp.]|jgi:periplasmic protein TorT|nr:TMAO reductase system periplasmic protein TorT [Reyranella sp.]
MRKFSGIAFSMMLATQAGGAFAADDWTANLMVDEKNPTAVYKPLPVGAVSKPWHLCVAFPHMKDAYYVAKDYGVLLEAKRQGVSATIMAANGYDDIAGQIQQIEDCVAAGGNAVLVNAVSKSGLNGMIDELAKKKIPVLDLGNGVTSDKIAAAALAQYYYAGATAGKYLAETFPAGSGKKKMVWLAGPAGSQWVEDAVRGMKEAIAGSDVDLVKVIYGDTGKAAQMKLLEDALQTYPDLTIIGGVAPAIEGAMEIVKEKNIRDKKLIAFYSTPPIEQAVRDGIVMATVNDNNLVGSRISVDQAIRLLEGKLEVKVASRKFSIVDSKNVNTYDRATLLAPNDFKPVFKVDAPKK